MLGWVRVEEEASGEEYLTGPDFKTWVVQGMEAQSVGTRTMGWRGGVKTDNGTNSAIELL